MTNLDSILKSRDITLPTKVHSTGPQQIISLLFLKDVGLF